MARNGYIPEDVAKRAQAEPIRVVARSPVKTEAPAAIESVLDELARHGEGRFGVRGPLPGAHLGAVHGGRAGTERS